MQKPRDDHGRPRPSSHRADLFGRISARALTFTLAIARALVLPLALILALTSGFALARLDPSTDPSTPHILDPMREHGQAGLVAAGSAHRTRAHAAIPPSPRIHFPTLSPAAATASECAAELAIMSLGPVPSQAIIARFAPAADGGCSACAGPTSIECTGLLRPGRAWRLLLAPGESSGSAVVLSLSAEPLERIVPGGGPAPIASIVCAALQAAIGEGPEPADRCAAWSEFEAAWGSGAGYGGVPLGLAVGSAIGGQVVATCPEGLAAMPAAFPVESSSRHVLPRLGPADAIIVQNAGAECVSIVLSTRAFSGCGAWSDCATFELPPGASRSIPARSCGPFGSGGSAAPGSAAIIADGPIAVALARSDGAGSNLVPSPATAEGKLAAPLAFDPEQGWTTAVDVRIVADDVGDVSVTVEFLDGDGTLATRIERRICAGGTHTFERTATTALPGLDTGAVRVTALRADGSGEPARIAATVRLTRGADAGPGEQPGAGGASAVYSLTPLDGPGVGLLAVPSLSKRGETDDGSSAIALANMAAAGNETEYALMLFDPSGLIDTACGTLAADSVEYIDLDRWTSVPAGFRGSAVISATRWRHAGSETPPDGAPVRLAAVIARWAGESAGDDRLALTSALELPFGSEPADAFARTLPALPCEPGVPIPGTTATNTPRATSTRTPRPPATATVPPPEDFLLWLPFSLRAHLVRLPTATPSPTMTPSPTATPEVSPDPSGTAESTGTPGPSPEPSGTAGSPSTPEPPPDP